MSERAPDPTPEEIRQMCEEIQAGWSEEEKARRRFGCLRSVQASHWEPPMIKDMRRF